MRRPSRNVRFAEVAGEQVWFWAVFECFDNLSTWRRWASIALDIVVGPFGDYCNGFGFNEESVVREAGKAYGHAARSRVRQVLHADVGYRRPVLLDPVVNWSTRSTSRGQATQPVGSSVGRDFTGDAVGDLVFLQNGVVPAGSRPTADAD